MEGNELCRRDLIVCNILMSLGYKVQAASSNCRCSQGVHDVTRCVSLVSKTNIKAYKESNLFPLRIENRGQSGTLHLESRRQRMCKGRKFSEADAKRDLNASDFLVFSGSVDAASSIWCCFQGSQSVVGFISLVSETNPKAFRDSTSQPRGTH